MNLQDFRRIINQLIESEALWDDPATEDLIEKTLADVPPEDAKLIRDALDVLKLKKRLLFNMWVEGLMHMYNTGVMRVSGTDNENLDFEHARLIVNDTAALFDRKVIYRTRNDAGQEIWCWEDSSPAAPQERDPSRQEPAPFDHHNPIHAAALAQNEIMGTLRERAAGMEYFNVGTLARIVQGMGYDSNTARMLAQHFLDTHGWMLTKADEQGNYRVKPDDQAPQPRGAKSPEDYTNQFRSWINTAGDQNREG